MGGWRAAWQGAGDDPVTFAARASRSRIIAAVPWAAAAVALGTLIAGAYVRGAGRPVGLPYAPLTGNWNPQADLLVAVTIACFAAAVTIVPRLLRGPAWVFALATLGLTLVLRLVLAAGSGGTDQWSAVFDESGFEGPNEYLPALGALDFGAGFFVDRFAELVPAMPVHAAGHPPGLLLTLHALGIDSPGGMAALCIGVGALSGPLCYLLARELLDERRARLAALLLALAPGALLFGATSADAVYLTLGLLAAWPFAARRRLIGAAALAAASFFAWSLLAVGAWAAIVTLRRDGLRAAITLSAICGMALVAFYALLYAATGFDPIGALRSTEEVYRAGIASTRPYWFWLFGSPVAFLLVLGLPISWLALRALAAGDDLAVAIFAVIAIAAVAGFTKAETERIWLFLAPFVCLAAAGALGERARLIPLFAALAAQAVLYELAFDTVW
jgi:methylthioxylose transferase